MKSILVALLLFFPTLSMAGDFDSFQSLLDQNLVVTELSGGGLQTAFDYEKALKNPKTKDLVKNQTDLLAKFDTKTLDTKEKAIAFWINTYNFFMVKIVLDKGTKGEKLTINSVKDFGSFFSPYKIFKEEINKVGGKNLSLDQIEKGTLLGDEYKKKGWKDARIHFAVNCASVGCPPIIQKVYTEKSLNDTLDSNIKKAFKTERHLRFKGHDLHLTHLFKWYEKDFKEAAGSVKDFIKKFIEDPKVQNSITNADGIEYIEYDWNLNKPSNFK